MQMMIHYQQMGLPLANDSLRTLLQQDERDEPQGVQEREVKYAPRLPPWVEFIHRQSNEILLRLSFGLTAKCSQQTGPRCSKRSSS